MKYSTIEVEGNVFIKKGVELEGDIKIANRFNGFQLPIHYNIDAELVNRPLINNVELLDNKTSEELGLEPTIHDITEQDIDNMMYGG